MEKEILKTIFKWILSLTMIASPTVDQGAKELIYFDESDEYIMVLGNAYYEVGFLKSNGAISYIIDQSTGHSVTEGSREGCLWRASLYIDQNIDQTDQEGPNHVAGCDYDATAPSNFGYRWSDESQTLILNYDPDPSAKRQVRAEVAVRASAGYWFDMSLELEHESGEVLQAVDFPAKLLFRETEIKEALLPLLPGIALQPAFFEKDRSYVRTYPAPMFADYLAVSSNLGELALYSLHEEAIQPVSLGVRHDKASEEELMFASHAFQTFVRDGQRWRSPTVRISISQSPLESIKAYRTDNGVDSFPSLSEKLDEQYEQIAQSPLLKADSHSLYNQYDVLFADYEQDILANLPSPAIFHLVAYWEDEFDENYPDFFPPNASYGTPEEFVQMIEQAQAMNFVVMPYTNPTWWDDESPTLQKLPSPLNSADLAVRDKEGTAVYKSYGERGGLVMSPYLPFVQQRVAKVIEQMTRDVPSDLLFEDQIGARPWLFDYNPSSPSPTAYSQGWFEHTRDYRDKGLMTEEGYDRLAETVVGFHGGMLLREREGNGEKWWGKDTWRPYPLASLIARDKVLFYQHNLDSKTMTKDNATLTWNLAFGYMLAHNLSKNKYGGGLNSEWLHLVSAFQKEVLAHYADELVTNFVYLDEHVTKTTFESFEVIANWHQNESYRVGGHTLPPLGVITRKHDHTLVAGVFTHYNNRALNNGDHYIIEARQPKQIIVRQPMGAKTILTLKALPTWHNNDPVIAEAYNQKDELIGEISTSMQDQEVTFVYKPQINGQNVAYVMLSLLD